ncbi:DUF2953 domain-containing protein [Paenibacillus cremeus]|nr:DUF2953 domain-containing protein [Paenibacillus cremeus]
MHWVWIGAACLLIVLALIAVSKVKIMLVCSRRKNNDEFTLHVKALYGIVRLRFKMPLMKFKGLYDGLVVKTEQVNASEGNLMADQKRHIKPEDIKQAFKDVRELLHHCFHFNEWLKGCLAQVHCTKLIWNTSVGVGDAPETAITAGMVWGLKTSLLGYIFRFIQLETRPKLQVVPVFNGMAMDTEIESHGYIRVIHIMMAGVQLLIRVLKVKDGWKTWRSILQRAAKRPV